MSILIRMAVLLLLLTSPLAAARPPRQPHIVVVLFDAARADFFGAYGQKDPTTPNIDRLAQNGIVFRNHYSNAVSTRASLAHMFTSRYEAFPILQYTPDTNVDDAWWMRDEIMPANATLLPKVLREAGYRTVLVSAHPFTTEHTILLKTFREFVRIGPRPGEAFASAERVFGAAKDIVRDHEKRFPAKPLFLYVHILDTHMPYQVSGSEDAFIKGAARRWSAEERKKRRPLGLPHVQESLGRDSVELLVGEAKSRYAYADAQFGQFVAHVERNLRSPFAWFLTSDHGEALGEDNLISHHYPMFAMKELHHIPLIAGGNALKTPSRSVDALTSTIDLFPTILDLGGIRLPSRIRIDGESLLPLARGARSTARSGILEIMRLGWKTSRLAYRTKDTTYVVTEWDEMYRRADTDEDFNRTKEVPAAFTDLVARYRVREQKRQVLPRSSHMLVPVFDLELDRELWGRYDTCWSIPPWRYYQDRYPMNVRQPCVPLRLRVALPDGVYRASWKVGTPDPCANTKSLLTVQTSGSTQPLTFHCANVASGSLDLGAVTVRDGSLRIWVGPKQQAQLWLADLHLQRIDAKLGEDRKLTPEEIERLKSLGYVQ